MNPTPAEHFGSTETAVYGTLDVAVSFDQAQALLTAHQKGWVEPLRRGPYAFVTLVLRQRQDDAGIDHNRYELCAAGVRAQVVMHRLDTVQTHAPIHLASPHAALRLVGAPPTNARVFPLLAAAERALGLPTRVVTTEAGAPLRLHHVGFEHAEAHGVAVDNSLQAVGVISEQGGLDWLVDAGQNTRVQAWWRPLGAGRWRGERGEPVQLLEGGALGGALWGVDAEKLRPDPQPLVPPAAQITPDPQPAARQPRVLAAS